MGKEKEEKLLSPLGVLKHRFGNRLRALRRLSNLTQAEFGQVVGGVGQNTITRLENGSADSISFEALMGILHFAHERNWSADFLLMSMSPLCLVGFNALHDEMLLRITAEVFAAQGVRMQQPTGEEGPVTADDIRTYGGVEGYLKNCFDAEGAGMVIQRSRARIIQVIEECASNEVLAKLGEALRDYQNAQRELRTMGESSRDDIS